MWIGITMDTGLGIVGVGTRAYSLMGTGEILYRKNVCDAADFRKS